MMQYITPNGAYHVTEHGNGWAYEITCRATRVSLWFQGQDAGELRHRSEDFTDEDAIRVYFDDPYLVPVRG
jgi:hypothetical protein